MTYLFTNSNGSELIVVPVDGNNSNFNQKFAEAIVEKRYPNNKYLCVGKLIDALDTVKIDLSERTLETSSI